MILPSDETAREFITAADFPWHQRFPLSESVHTPGLNDIEWLLARAGLPGDLDGLSVLDVGTTNGGAAFLLERLGARRVVAVDIYPGETYGFEETRAFLQSGVEFVQASVYELPSLLDEMFDVIIFWGVLYHLRHPLLGLDNLRRLCRPPDEAHERAFLSIETAVADASLGTQRGQSLARFYRTDELEADSKNWFAPSTAALTGWLGSAGFDVQTLHAWPEAAPERAMLLARPHPGEAEYSRVSYERPLHLTVEPGDPRRFKPIEPHARRVRDPS